MTISALPTPPSRSDPANFAARADLFLSALALFVTQTNDASAAVNTNASAAAASATTALNAPGTSASSTTSLVTGTGSRSLTIQTGKLFVVGQFVVVASAGAPTNWMNGQITAHNSSTGALTVSVAYAAGLDTRADWNVALSSPADALLAALRDGLIPDGTVSVPAIRFAADTDTGISRVGANALAIICGGAVKSEFSANVTALFADATGYGLDIVGRASDNRSAMRYLSNDRFALSAYTGPSASGIYETVCNGGTSTASGTGTSHYWSIGGAGRFQIGNTYAGPAVDNVIACGGASARYTVVYAASGAISTSDERLKTWRGGLTEAEIVAAREIAGMIGVYQFNDAIAEKGVDGARLHIGVKAQQVWGIMAAHGLVDPIGSDGKPGDTPYAFLCFDEWEAEDAVPATPATAPRAQVYGSEGEVVVPADPGSPGAPGREGRVAGNIFSVRADELNLFISAAQEQRLLALED